MTVSTYNVQGMHVPRYFLGGGGCVCVCGSETEPSQGTLGSGIPDGGSRELASGKNWISPNPASGMYSYGLRSLGTLQSHSKI